MTQISDGRNEISLEVVNHQVQITLQPQQYQSNSEAIVASTLPGNSLFLPGEITEFSEEKLALSYELPARTLSLKTSSQKEKLPERLQLAIALSQLSDWQSQNINLFLAPENIFVNEGLIKIAYRGFDEVMVPEHQTNDEFLASYKALVLATINPKYNFVDLVNGSDAVTDKFSQAILQAPDIATITSIVQRRYRQITENQIPVNEKTYRIMKWGFISLIVISLGLAGFLGYNVWYNEPKQARIIDSQAAFMDKNYDQTTSILKHDDPQKLSKSAQYILAASYINLDTLTSKQKTSILNNISPQSNTNNLLYWIYLGRGDLKRSLSLAKNLGDDQLTLYTYTKLYDVTKADNKMDGSEKQKRLNSYKQSIKKYVKKLGGKTNGVEK